MESSSLPGELHVIGPTKLQGKKRKSNQSFEGINQSETTQKQYLQQHRKSDRVDQRNSENMLDERLRNNDHVLKDGRFIQTPSESTNIQFFFVFVPKSLKITFLKKHPLLIALVLQQK